MARRQYRIEHDLSREALREIDAKFAAARLSVVQRTRFWDACRLFGWANRDALAMADEAVKARGRSA